MSFQSFYLVSIYTDSPFRVGSKSMWESHTWQDLAEFFSFYLVQDVHNWCHIPRCTITCHLKSDLIPRCVKSILDFKVSFVLPSILRSVPIMLSHTLFSMCITSRLCRRSKSFQYSKSHKVDLRVNNNLSSALPCFLFPLPSFLV